MTFAQNQVTIKGTVHEPAEVYAAWVQAGLSTQVKRGENAGRQLTHAPTVRMLELIGHIGKDQTTYTGALPTPDQPNGYWVVFAQAPGPGKVLGIGKEV